MTIMALAMLLRLRVYIYTSWQSNKMMDLINQLDHPPP